MVKTTTGKNGYGNFGNRWHEGKLGND